MCPAVASDLFASSLSENKKYRKICVLSVRNFVDFHNFVRIFVRSSAMLGDFSLKFELYVQAPSARLF